MALLPAAGSVVGASSSTSITKPAGYTDTANDLILILLQSNQSSTAPTAPTGFTQLTTLTTGTGQHKIFSTVAYKLNSGSETWPKAWTAGSGSIFDVWSCVILRGNDTTTPIDANGQVGVASGTSGNITALTASVAGDALVILQTDELDVAVSTWPTGVTEYTPASNATGNGVDTGTATGLASGSTGTLSITTGASPGTWQSFAVLVKAAGAGGSTVNGSATIQGNAALVESAAQVVEPSGAVPVQVNATLAEAAQLVALSAPVQANAALVETAAQVVTLSDPLQANAALVGSALIVAASAGIQANAALAQSSAQVIDPSAPIQANAVLIASGNIGGIVNGAASFVSNSVLAETAARIVTSATMQSNSVLAEVARILAGLTPVQANALLAAAGTIVGQYVIGLCSTSTTPAHGSITLADRAVNSAALSSAALGSEALSDSAVNTAGVSSAGIGTVALADS